MPSVLIILGLLTLLPSLLIAAPPTSRIAAVINKIPITQADLMHRIRLAAFSSGLNPTPENLEKLKPQILRIMIDEKLQLSLGATYKIVITEKQIQEAISRLETANEMPVGHLAKMTKEAGIPPKTLEDQIKANLTWMEFVRGKYLDTLQISDAEIEQEKAIHRERETKNLHRLAEIVLPFDTPEQEAQVQEDINRLVEGLQKGVHFAALAQQFSQSATAAQGGDMGWLTEEQLLPEVREFIQHMEPGQLSRPIRTAQGYIIIGYIDKKLAGSEKVTELSDLEAKNRVAERKLSLLSNRELRDLRRHAFVDIRMQ